MRGTIRARGKGRWQIQVYAGRGPDGREHRVARTIHGKRADADQALRQLIREVEAGQHRGDDPTVTQLAEQWYTARSSAWSPRTRTTYRATIDQRITPHLGHRRARTITTRDLDLLYATLTTNGDGPQTIRKTHTVIRSMYTQAVRWGITTTNPAVHATPPAITPAPIEPLRDLDEGRRVVLRALARDGFAPVVLGDGSCLRCGALRFDRSGWPVPAGLVFEGFAPGRPMCEGCALRTAVGFGDDVWLADELVVESAPVEGKLRIRPTEIVVVPAGEVAARIEEGRR